MGKFVDFSNAGTSHDATEPSFETVAAALLQNAESVCKRLVPLGRKNGKEYVAGSMDGGKGRSFSVNLDTGVWKEFGEGGRGGADLINLWAAKRGISQREAKLEAALQYMGYAPTGGASTPRHNPGVRHAVTTPAKPGSHGAGAKTTPATQGEDDDPLWWRGIPHTNRWDYIDGDGQMVMAVYRFVHPVTRKKTIRPWNYETNQWEAAHGIRPLLYLPEMLRSAGTVVLVEGEKCADSIVALGMLATTIAGGASAVNKTDFSPLGGRDVICWRDNDAAGKEWLEHVHEKLREVGAASVRDCTISPGKPPKWDCADADEAERRAIVTAAQGAVPVITGRPKLVYADWTADRFVGKAPVRTWLVREVLPLGVSALFAATGDTGKGMVMLDLALKVATGKPDPVLAPMAFGSTIMDFGSALILSAEDDQGELHRRLERLDPAGNRFHAGNRLLLVPLPNTGGAPSLIKTAGGSLDVTEDFERLRDQALSMENLKLVVIDPLASFVQADLNKDSAAAAFISKSFAMLAAETGACIVITHHMRKLSGAGNTHIDTPEQARDAIRGSTALVDGQRVAYAMWPHTERGAQSVLKNLGEPIKGGDWRGRVVRGAVVKSNGPADRTVRTYVRDMTTGLLIDRTASLGHIERDEREDLAGLLITAVARAAAEGQPFMHYGSASPYRRREALPEKLRVGKNTLEGLTQRLLEEGKLRRCIASGTTVKWLDVPGGPFDKGMGTFAKGGMLNADLVTATAA